LDEVVGAVDPVHVEARGDTARPLRLILRRELALHEASESLDRGGRGDALRAAADPDAHVDARLVPGRIDPAGNVAVEQEPRSGARRADLFDQPLMPRTIEHRDPHLA